MADQQEIQWIHDIPGQHMYKGVMYFASQPTEVLDRIPYFQFTSDDVLVSTYPKSGMCIELN